jgi:fructose-1-phosphate kinase PfkB-like protein
MMIQLLNILSLITMALNTEAFSIVIGVNPALQKRFILSSKTPTLIPGDVHRASQIQVGIGGKGQDVSVTLGCLSADKSYVFLAQFLGKGSAGDLALSKLKEALHEVDDSNGSSSLEALTIRTVASLRTCTTIVAEDSATELVEPSGKISPGEIQTLMDKIDNVTFERRLRGLCIMGSMPPGCPQNLYGHIFAKIAIQHPQTITVIDTVVGLEPLFQHMRTNNDITEGNRMLKVNFAELCRLANVRVKSETAEASQGQIKDAITAFLATFTDARPALDYIAITNGCHPAHLACIQCESKGKAIYDLFRLSMPSLSILQLDIQSKTFPIGAGDSVTAGTLAAWECLCINDCTERLSSDVQNALKQKLDSPCGNIAAVSFAFGIACGSASCAQEENSVLVVNDALTLFGYVDIKKLSH